MDDSACDAKRRQQRGLESDPVIRQHNTTANRCVVMQLLRGEKYASVENIALALGMTVQGTRRILNRMLREDLVVNIAVPEWSRTTVWGASHYGIFQYFPPGVWEQLSDDEVERLHTRHLTKGKVNPSKYAHTIEVQSIRVTLESWAGCGTWTAERDLPYFAPSQKNRYHQWPKYPDGILALPGLLTIALEIERSNKSTRKYADICRKHQNNIRHERYDHVLYVCQSARQQAELEKKIGSRDFISICILDDDMVAVVQQLLRDREAADKAAELAAQQAALAAQQRQERVSLLAAQQTIEVEETPEMPATKKTGRVAQWWQSLED